MLSIILFVLIITSIVNTKNKLKLNPMNKTQKFASKFQNMKKITTFIDLSENLKKLNYLN